MKKMLDWEMEAWAAWQVIQEEGSSLLMHGGRGWHASALASAPQAFSSVGPSCLLLAGQKHPRPSESTPELWVCVLQCSRLGCGCKRLSGAFLLTSP